MKCINCFNLKTRVIRNPEDEMDLSAAILKRIEKHKACRVYYCKHNGVVVPKLLVNPPKKPCDYFEGMGN